MRFRPHASWGMGRRFFLEHVSRLGFVCALSLQFFRFPPCLFGMRPPFSFGWVLGTMFLGNRGLCPFGAYLMFSLRGVGHFEVFPLVLFSLDQGCCRVLYLLFSGNSGSGFCSGAFLNFDWLCKTLQDAWGVPVLTPISTLRVF